jgi:hypothetical protein
VSSPALTIDKVAFTPLPGVDDAGQLEVTVTYTCAHGAADAVQIFAIQHEPADDASTDKNNGSATARTTSDGMPHTQTLTLVTGAPLAKGGKGTVIADLTIGKIQKVVKHTRGDFAW